MNAQQQKIENTVASFARVFQVSHYVEELKNAGYSFENDISKINHLLQDPFLPYDKNPLLGKVVKKESFWNYKIFRIIRKIFIFFKVADCFNICNDRAIQKKIFETALLLIETSYKFQSNRISNINETEREYFQKKCEEQFRLQYFSGIEKIHNMSLSHKNKKNESAISYFSNYLQTTWISPFLKAYHTSQSNLPKNIQIENFKKIIEPESFDKILDKKEIDIPLRTQQDLENGRQTIYFEEPGTTKLEKYTKTGATRRLIEKLQKNNVPEKQIKFVVHSICNQTLLNGLTETITPHSSLTEFLKKIPNTSFGGLKYKKIVLSLDTEKNVFVKVSGFLNFFTEQNSLVASLTTKISFTFSLKEEKEPVFTTLTLGTLT